MTPRQREFPGRHGATAAVVAIVLSFSVAACTRPCPPPQPPPTAKAPAPCVPATPAKQVKAPAKPKLPSEPKACKAARQFDRPALSRDDFNRLAMLDSNPLFWVEDRDNDCQVDPDELVAAGSDGIAKFVRGGKLTGAFGEVYRALVDLRRREAVRRELNGGRPTIVHTDFSKANAADRYVLQQLLAAARIIEDLHLHQTGAFAYKKAVARADGASQYLFWRNHGPWCSSPETAGDRFCSALDTFPQKRSEAYPGDIAQDDAMCKMLEEQPNAKDLLNPFTVVRKKKGGGFSAVPLNKVFGKQMKAVAKHLKLAAARVAKAAPEEKAFGAYLSEAAAAFESNSWEEADEKWAAMNAKNSKWYLRVGPDEVYFDPCQQKAGFHVALALID